MNTRSVPDAGPARRTRPEPRCPVRPAENCRLCVPGTTGPEDCPVVAMVMEDPDLRAELARLRAELRDGSVPG